MDRGIAHQIRDSSPFPDRNTPLYVINDVPVAPGLDGALPGIDPRDLVSIKVLTGTAARGPRRIVPVVKRLL
jgi:hypothetical protein